MGITKSFRKILSRMLGRKPVKVERALSDSDVPVQVYIDTFGEEAVSGRPFYNVGGGTRFVHPAWTVINHPSEHYGKDYMDLQWDLMSRTPMPIEDGMAKVIFSRYTLEHVPDVAVQHFFDDAYRCLDRGGYLRIIVPDIEIYYKAYREQDPAPFHRPGQVGESFPNTKFSADPNSASFEQRFLWTFASSVSTLHADGAPERISDQEFRDQLDASGLEAALNFATSKAPMSVQRKYPENHINWFSAKKLERMIRGAGFKTVYRSKQGSSNCEVLRDVALLETRRPEIALYMEAVR